MIICSGYFFAVPYYLQPSVWIGDSVPSLEPDMDLGAFSDVVYAQALHGGMTCKAFREGLFVFEVPEQFFQETGDVNCKERIQASAKRTAQGAALLNCHLVCLYSALCDPVSI